LPIYFFTVLRCWHTGKQSKSKRFRRIRQNVSSIERILKHNYLTLGGFKLAENNLLQQAVDAVNNFLTNQGGQNANKQQQQQAAQNTIQTGYNDANTPEEQHQLQQLERRLKQNSGLR